MQPSNKAKTPVALTTEVSNLVPTSQRKETMQTIPNQVTVVTNSGPMMSSREIAKLTKKQHAHVVRDIWTVLEQLYSINKDDPNLDDNKNQKVRVIDGVNAAIDARGYVSEFLLDRRHTEILITGYDIKRRANVIDRWFELEQTKAVDPMVALSDPAVLRSTLLTYTEKVLTLEHKVEEMRPDVEAFERIAKKSDGSMCLTDAAKHLQVPPRAMIQTLSQQHWIYKRAGGKAWVGYQDKIQQGCLEHKVTTVQLGDGSEKIATQVLVTAKGITRLSKMLQGGIQ